MNRITPLVLVSVMFSACGTTVTSVPLNPRGKIEFVEHRTILSTTPVAVLYDETGRIVGITAGSGTSIAEVFMGGVQAGAMVGAASIIAGGLKSLQRIETVTSGTVQTTGTVTGAFDPLQVSPVQMVAPPSLPNINLVPVMPVMP